MLLLVRTTANLITHHKILHTNSPSKSPSSSSKFPSSSSQTPKSLSLLLKRKRLYCSAIPAPLILLKRKRLYLYKKTDESKFSWTSPKSLGRVQFHPDESNVECPRPIRALQTYDVTKWPKLSGQSESSLLATEKVDSLHWPIRCQERK